MPLRSSNNCRFAILNLATNTTMKLRTCILAVVLPFLSNAQTDTIFTWLNAQDKETTIESAVYVRKQYTVDGICNIREYHLGTGALTWEATYDASCKKKHGILNWYSDSGRLREKSVYENDARKEHHIFYANGNKRMEAYFQGSKLTSVKGWDKDGNEIPNSIYEQEAAFPGGMKAWQQYLTRSITKGLPAVYKKGYMSGIVIVDFQVDTTGAISEVRVSTSSGFPELDAHALEIIKRAPKWIPAIQYNAKVIYRQRQAFTYQPYEE